MPKILYSAGIWSELASSREAGAYNLTLLLHLPELYHAPLNLLEDVNLWNDLHFS